MSVNRKPMPLSPIFIDTLCILADDAVIKVTLF